MKTQSSGGHFSFRPGSKVFHLSNESEVDFGNGESWETFGRFFCCVLSDKRLRGFDFASCYTKSVPESICGLIRKKLLHLRFGLTDYWLPNENIQTCARS